MAGHARLKLALLAAVLLAHFAGLDWFARMAAERESVLRTVTTPMFTRLIQPEAPKTAPPPAPAPRKAARKKATPAEAQVLAALPLPQPVPSEPETATATVAPPEPQLPQIAAPEEAQVIAQTQTEMQTQTQAVPPPEVLASAAAAPDKSADKATDTWPGDTRLTYSLSGLYRGGDLYGSARVQWQREGANYQTRLDIDITPFVSMVMTSQGEVTGQGLVPRAYEEVRQGKRRAARFGDNRIQLDGGKSATRPDGVQDTVSQFVELTHRFATGRAALEVGQAVTFWMARPGGVDLWTYDIVERETLKTQQLGAVDAFRLKPRPIVNPRGNVTVDMWFAPSLQYLPVRIKVNFGDDAFVDLLVEKIEQR